MPAHIYLLYVYTFITIDTYTFITRDTYTCIPLETFMRRFIDVIIDTCART